MINTTSYVAVIDVGHGNSTIIRDGNQVIIVDCGQRSSLMEFLIIENVYTIDSIMLSHADNDHIGGLTALISSGLFNVGKIYVNSDSTKTTKVWDDLLYDLSQTKNILNPGLSFNSEPFRCGDIILKVVGPSPYLSIKSPGSSDKHGRQITSNSISASFHVIWKEQIIAYLAGDIDQISLDDLIDHEANLQAQVLVFPHHGGKSNNADVVKLTEQLCDLTKASIVIFSIGRRKHNNPRPDIIRTLRSKIPDVRVACTQLSKHCAIDLPVTKPTHLVSTFSQGEAQRESCGGTFVIKLGNSIEYWPNAKSHREFILSAAPTALCF